MRLSITRADLARVLTNVGRVIESRNTMPILSNVLLSAKDGRLQVTGTDLDIVATDATAADVTESGSICVDAKLLADISKKAGGDISISMEGDRLVVKSGRSRFALPTLAAADLPTFGADDYTASFEADLAALFAPVAFAIGNDANRPYLHGVFFHVMDGKAVAVATNGHRLARHTGQELPEFDGVIVPQKAVGMLPKGLAQVSVNENIIRIVFGDFTLTSKLIDGTFPDYRRVIPTENDLVASAEKDDLLKASDRVATVSSERGNAVKLSIAPGAIALTVNSVERGEAADEVQAEYSGKPVDIGFNSIYFRDALQVFPAGLVNLALRDSGSPALITSPVYPALDITLMPMRV
ncbi:DNA polymerase III subunit beta [Rhizobium laguerreae]|uniref:DNA polymerase III subunit beta n=1 Tax=Rhizobium laguerreae TaxID=1076926 RepID=UPI001C8FFF15|nr:DNA polymerase III subunit beta [Rhizobium laguerreae]MBY3543631.1 DNA polymerase III subunit beta [Rhizobium laguerreae]